MFQQIKLITWNGQRTTWLTFPFVIDKEVAMIHHFEYSQKLSSILWHETDTGMSSLASRPWGIVTLWEKIQKHIYFSPSQKK